MVVALSLPLIIADNLTASPLEGIRSKDRVLGSIPRPQVGVLFKVKESSYLERHWSRSEKREVEQKAAMEIAGKLNKLFPFLVFSTEENDKFLLIFELRSKKIPSRIKKSSLRSVYMSLRLEGAARIRKGKDIDLPFRTPNEWGNPFGRPGSFLSELYLRLEREDYEKVHFQAIQEKVLSRICLADQGRFLRDSSAWIIPFHECELNLDRGSRVEIEHHEKDHTGSGKRFLEAEYKWPYRPEQPTREDKAWFDKIYCEYSGSSDQHPIKPMIGSRLKSVTGIYIKRYLQRDISCNSGPLPPEQVNFRVNMGSLVGE